MSLPRAARGAHNTEEEKAHATVWFADALKVFTVRSISDVAEVWCFKTEANSVWVSVSRFSHRYAYVINVEDCAKLGVYHLLGHSLMILGD